MYENAKLCIVMKMVRVFVKNERPPTVLFLEKKKIIIFVDTVKLKKMLGIVFSIDICTRHKIILKMLILTFEPILDTQCQLWVISKISELAVPAVCYDTVGNSAKP